MSKSDAGTKQTCPECAAKFYDLNKRPAVCPKCEHSYNPDAGSKPVKKRELEPEVEIPVDAVDAEEAGAKPANEAEVEIEGLDAEEEEAKSLELDGDNPIIGVGVDGDDEDADVDAPDATAALPEGFTEEGVEDDADALVDTDDEEIDLDVDLDES
ncbi:MAG: TIGR02300 family protein [Robiginitomaculum sp.]|nr:TIGR02300 family protein [Robiginitomaculum sp.]MDQ7076698.1 TIGR02300 family protein [Robiginitomaculum sp.]